MKIISKGVILTATVATVLILSLACSRLHGETAKPIPLSGKPAPDLAARFGQYYEPVAVNAQPAVPAYTLPLAPGGIQNLAHVQQKLGLAGAPALLLQNGFVTIPGGGDDVVAVYESLKEKEVPVFITSDSVLHLYHIQFDETLREIEEKEFYPDLIGLTKALQAEMQKRYQSAKSGPEKQAFKKGLAYFTVGRKLLEPGAPAPAEVSAWVKWELDRIDKHEGFPNFDEAVKNAIFAYPEDYSQYVPRGHYTRSDELKRYFKAMMWYGRITMLIKGDPKFGPDSADPTLVSVEEAQAQTILGASIAALLPALKVDARGAQEVWQRIYAVTAYYVGLADDLTPDDYRAALRAAGGDAFVPGDLADPARLLKFKTELARLAPPVIYSGTGASVVNMDRGATLTAKDLDAILGKTMGFRLMGQRYVPDSYILGQLVAPVIGLGTNPSAFTAYTVPDLGIARVFPRGLDVMAALGSDRARAIIGKLGDADYKNYDKRLAELREQFGKISPADWNRNLYWSWLYAIKGLISPTAGAGWPTFMTTDAWQDKELNAALGTWSSLRHDTILYAKQSYTPELRATSVMPMPPMEPPKPVVGYVEPVPEFYARLVALTRMSAKGLKDLKALDPDGEARLTQLEGLLARLQGIAEKELKNEVLTEDDYGFIRDFGASLSAVVAGASEAGQKTVLIADVHTDQNQRAVLEEGTGYLRLLLVAYKLPQGHILVGAGPAYSYYEFKHPMNDRLTDEKWREMLDGAAPALPEWTRTFAQF